MTNKYYPTIGLEIHAELKTLTKMFCGCQNNPDEEKPNVNICPVCTAHPGALPVPNKKAIENVIKVGLALHGQIADFTEFDRKNYFYPDIPKGYQISQYKYPIVKGGRLGVFDITRVHLEEDTANNKHDRGNFSLIDFNRAGVPLLELVTEPHTFENSEEAAKLSTQFAKEFQLILWYLGVSEANMEKGEMRVEANISVSSDPKVLGTKVEVKNLNSFRSVERAIKYEVDRMTELLEDSKESEIVQETRGWDEGKQRTFSQRKKESSQDYRYFPDPDLPKMYLHGTFSAQGGPSSGWDLEKMKKDLPELPTQKRARYKKDYGIKDEDIESYINEPVLGAWFEDIAKKLKTKEIIQVASNYITSDYIGIRKNYPKIIKPDSENFAQLITMVADGVISSRGAKNILALMVVNNKSPMILAKEDNLLQKSDKESLRPMLERIIDINPNAVADYKKGKENALMFLVGQAMKESKGSVNPQIVKGLLIDLLK
jgi:aspartyl-tRNA(Asn)/glutamyl-tRNA(Gln) amidotransferase subunit B